MYVESDWKNYSLEHARAVVKRTAPVNFTSLEEKIRGMYFMLNLPQPKHFIVVKNPLEMFALQLYIEGKVDRYDRLDDIYKYYGNIIDTLPKKTIPMTPELVEYALAISWMVDEIVKDPLCQFDPEEIRTLLDGRRPSEILASLGNRPVYYDVLIKAIMWLIMLFNQSGFSGIKTVTEVVDFEDESKSGVKLDSFEDNVFTFVKRLEDTIEEILKQGYYNVSGHKVEVKGWPKLDNPDDFANIAYNTGNWACWVSDFKYLCETFNFSHPIIDALVELAEAGHYWVAYDSPELDNGYVIMCDNPSVLEIDGPDSRLHNEDGPAIGYNGLELYFWNNTLIPPWFIGNKLNDTINKNTITNESHQEMRRILFEIYGYENWLKDVDAEIIDEAVINGSPYRLFETVDERDNNLHILECVDGSLKNGNYQVYYLLTDRELRTCRESVANSYNAAPEEYETILFRT